MRAQQIFVALICIFLASQQVAAVVNNGQSAKAEESKKSISETADAGKSSSANEADPVTASTEEKANRREAPLSLGDSYGVPLTVAVDSYQPSGQSNVNLPVPVYGVPDAPTNNIVYPAPPPDIPPPVSLPSPSYGLPVTSNNFGVPPVPAVTNFLPPADTYGVPSVKFEGLPLTPPKLSGFGRGTKPPRFQYGPPGKPLFNTKFSSKYPYKSNFGANKHTKPLSTYGPPSAYFKDNYNPAKLNVNFNNIFANANAIGQSTVSGHTGHSNIGGQSILQYDVPNVGYNVPNIAYGIPNVDVQTYATNLDLHGASNQYIAPDVSVQILSSNSAHEGHSISTQHGSLDADVLGSQKYYGPPQPSPHPKPPHPGAPAPPTPPDIKYDGWQPIPGLVSRVPTTSYGAPPNDAHAAGSLNFHKDLVPPPLQVQGDHHHHQQSSISYGETALTDSYGGSQNGVSDSYGAPLNTVTGSGGIVSSSGEEVHGQHLAQSGTIDIDIGQNVNSIKGIGIEIYPTGSGSVGGQSHTSGGYNLQIEDSYSTPPLNSYSSSGPYAAAHTYNNVGLSSLGFGSLNLHGSHNSHLQNTFNSHKSGGYKGISSNFGRGLIPPSGIYGIPPSGQYGTPLFINTPHGPPLNALKISPPKHPVVHREPVPPAIFDSITKQGSHKHFHGHSNQAHHGFSSTYLPPPVSDIPNLTKDYAPPLPSTLHSLPSAHSSISFQNVAHGLSSAGLLHQNIDLNIDGATSALSSYAAPLNVVDGSYNLPQSQPLTHTLLDGEVVGLDLSHPALTIDLTTNNHGKNGFHTTTVHALPHDCSLQKTQSLPSLSYGVPSASSYTASLSSLTTNIEGARSQVSLPQTNYGAPEVNSEVSYQVSEPHSSELHDSYDLHAAHSQKVSSEAKVNLIESESEGKAYGKSLAQSFGPNSELVQFQNLDLNNIPLQGALGSYTLQIQSADGSQGEVAHGQILNEGLLQSILAAIEQPNKNGGKPVVQLQQKSVEQENFVTNETISSVVGKLADAQVDHSSPVHYVVEPSNEVLSNVDEKLEEERQEDIPVVEDNGIALYFSNGQRSKKDSDESSADDKSSENAVQNSH